MKFEKGKGDLRMKKERIGVVLTQTLLRNSLDPDGCCLSSQSALMLLVRNAKVVDKETASEMA